MIRDLISKFWSWYERHHRVNIGIAAVLFSWQLIHLYWLSAEIVAFRLFGQSYFRPDEFTKILLIMADYAEIPALISTSLVYIHELRKKFSWKNLTLLAFVNSQWLHLFWITDEILLGEIRQQAPITLPFWLSGLAIGIDYLELPVIYSTLKKFLSPKTYAR